MRFDDQERFDAVESKVMIIARATHEDKFLLVAGIRQKKKQLRLSRREFNRTDYSNQIENHEDEESLIVAMTGDSISDA